jgi:hypothetical protein
MAAGITRVNGTPAAGVFHGGYQIAWYSCAAAGFYTNTGTSYTVYAPESPFEKAVRAIENVATVVVLGTPTSSGFIVGVDAGSFYGRGDSTGYQVSGAGDTALEVIDAAVTAALGGAVTTTAVAISGVAFA